MDLPWGDEKSLQFITNVGLITSHGPHGHNIMSAEWTHHISYSPGLIAVCVGFGKATLENIRATKEFGVNICSTGQSAMANVSGGSSGKEVDKIGALKELGFKFYEGKKIGALMVEGASLNAECRLFKEITMGDHVMLVGEVAEASVSGREPLAYHKGMYWILNKTAEKPSDEERKRMESVVKKYRKV
jgi:flavin reductase (DIM6/NTAB) family NADH-FMN oxidoreductase RutF